MGLDEPEVEEIKKVPRPGEARPGNVLKEIVVARARRARGDFMP